MLNDLDAETAPAPTTPGHARPGSATISIQIPRPTRRSWLAAAALAAVVALVLAMPVTRHWILGAGGSATGPQHYMAVLPLKVAGDETLQYVADGVVDALSAKLAGLSRVYAAPGIAVNAALSQKEPPKIAHALGVTLLVQGTVQGSGDRIAITVTMDDFGKNSRNLLHEDFSGYRKDLLTLEDHIFDRLVKVLVIRQSNEEQARTKMRPTQDFGAYDLYLRGRNLLRGRQSQKNIEDALGLFNKAIGQDAGFALAYAGSADACLAMRDLTKDNAWTQKALDAAQQAEHLNDSLPEIHFSLGTIYTLTGKTEEAIAELQHALQLAPNSDEGLRRLGRAYRSAGQRDKALDALTKAAAVNPYLWRNYLLLGNAYFKYGENQKALEAFRKITELEPDSSTGWASMGSAYFRLGKFSDCVGALRKAIDKQSKAEYQSGLGVAYFYLGQYSESVKFFEKAVEMNPSDSGFRTNLGDAYRWSGQRDKAPAVYDQAIKLAYKSLDVDPRNTYALSNLAICYAKTGDDKNALKSIQQARQLDADDVDLMYQEATIHALAGRTREAVGALARALTGISTEQAKNDPELAEIRRTPEFAKLLSKPIQTAAK